jgi:hypothetical protein
MLISSGFCPFCSTRSSLERAILYPGVKITLGASAVQASSFQGPPGVQFFLGASIVWFPCSNSLNNLAGTYPYIGMVYGTHEPPLDRKVLLQLEIRGLTPTSEYSVGSRFSLLFHSTSTFLLVERAAFLIFYLGVRPRCRNKLGRNGCSSCASHIIIHFKCWYVVPILFRVQTKHLTRPLGQG